MLGISFLYPTLKRIFESFEESIGFEDDFKRDYFERVSHFFGKSHTNRVRLVLDLLRLFLDLLRLFFKIVILRLGRLVIFAVSVSKISGKVISYLDKK